MPMLIKLLHVKTHDNKIAGPMIMKKSDAMKHVSPLNNGIARAHWKTTLVSDSYQYQCLIVWAHF